MSFLSFVNSGKELIFGADGGGPSEVFIVWSLELNSEIIFVSCPRAGIPRTRRNITSPIVRTT